jgi:hypothetical protein
MAEVRQQHSFRGQHRAADSHHVSLSSIGAHTKHSVSTLSGVDVPADGMGVADMLGGGIRNQLLKVTGDAVRIATSDLSRQLSNMTQRAQQERLRRKELEAENAALRRRICTLENERTSRAPQSRAASADVNTNCVAHSARLGGIAPLEGGTVADERAHLERQWAVFRASYKWMTQRMEEADLKLAAFEEARKRVPCHHRHDHQQY